MQPVRDPDLIHQLGGALAAGGFSVLFQPVFSLSTNRVVSVEGLPHWDHPVHGLLAPDALLSTSPPPALVEALGTWALRSSFRHAKAWNDAEPPLAVAV
ncbi:MAG: EAL domain-containing protein, partial [Ilumatobacter sp.]